METPQTESFMDRLFATPPWKSRAFFVWVVAIALLTVFHVVTDPATPASQTATPTDLLRISGSFGEAIVGSLLVVLLPYLIFLGLERIIRSAHLTLSQSKLANALAVVFALTLVVILIVMGAA